MSSDPVTLYDGRGNVVVSHRRDTFRDSVIQARNHLSHRISDRGQLARLAGFQYGTDRDIYKVAGYVHEEHLTFERFWSTYKRQDVAGRIVDMPAKSTWKHEPKISDPDADGFESELSTAYNAMAKRLKLHHWFERGDRISGIGRFGVLLIGVKGTDANLRLPIEPVNEPSYVMFVSAFHEGSVNLQTWVRDPMDPNFGKPETYQIDLSTGVPGFSAPDVTVHRSRVIHIAEGLVEDEVFGRPRLERVFNRLFDLEKVAACTGEAYWQLGSRILQAIADPLASFEDKDVTALGENLEEIIHDLRRQFIGQGVELKWLESETPDPAQAADLYFMLIAAGTTIPMRMLFGSETGERASTEDGRQWESTISARQVEFAEPMILRAFIDRMIEIEALPKPKSVDGYIVEWPPLHEATAQEKAETNKAVADTAKALTQIGVAPRRLVRIDERGVVMLLPDEEVDGEAPGFVAGGPEELSEDEPAVVDPQPPEEGEAAEDAA